MHMFSVRALVTRDKIIQRAPYQTNQTADSCIPIEYFAMINGMIYILVFEVAVSG